MEPPITASLANSSASDTNPFEDDATNFIFGNGNEAGGASNSPEQTPTATAATSTGSGAATAVANPPPAVAVQAAAAQPASSLSLTTISLLAGGAFLILHLLHK